VACLWEADGHAGADDLVALVARRDASVHRATVYRTLEALVSAGVVVQVSLPHGAAAYHVREVPAHLHALCTGCGVVVDLPGDLLGEVGVRTLREHGFELHPERAALAGHCEACRVDSRRPG